MTHIIKLSQGEIIKICTAHIAAEFEQRIHHAELYVEIVPGEHLGTAYIVTFEARAGFLDEEESFAKEKARPTEDNS